MQWLVAVIIRYASTIAQFVVTLIVARHLDPSGVGIYMILYGIVTSTYVAAGLGAPDGLVRLAPALSAAGDEFGAASLIKGGVRISCSVSVVMAVLLGAAEWAASGSVAVGAVAAVWWYGYAVCYVTAQGLVALGLPAFGTFMYYGAINWSTLIAVVGYGLLASQTSVLGMLLVSAVAAVGAGCIGICALSLHLPRSRSAAGFRQTATAARVGAPLCAGRVVQSLIIWSPVWLAGALFGADRAAGVALASRLVMAVGAAIAAVRFSVRPRLVKLAVANDWSAIEAEGKRIAVAASALCVAAAIGDVCLGPLILPKIFGSAYQSLWWILLVLLAGILAESMAGPTDEALKMSDGALFVLGAECASLVLGSVLQAALGAIFGLPALVVVATLSFAALYMVIVGELEERRGVRPAVLPPIRALGHGVRTARS